MSFNMQIDGAQKHQDVQDGYTPIKAGVYMAHIETAELDESAATQGDYVGLSRSILKVKFNVYNAKEDGGSRPYFLNLLLDHGMLQSPGVDAKKKANTSNMMKLNQNHLLDLITQVVERYNNGVVSGTPFATFDANTAAHLVGKDVAIELRINKKRGENEIQSLKPEAAPIQQAQGYAQPQAQQGYAQPQTQQPPMGNVPTQMNTSAPTGQQVPVNASQTAVSPSNGGMPPFAIAQGQ